MSSCIMIKLTESLGILSVVIQTCRIAVSFLKALWLPIHAIIDDIHFI